MTSHQDHLYGCFGISSPLFYDNSGGTAGGLAKLAVAALAAADAAPAGVSARTSEAAGRRGSLGGKRSSLGEGMALGGITVATPVVGEQLAAPGSSGGDDGGGADGGGGGEVPGNSEERESQDRGSQSSACAGREGGGGDASVASNTSSRASSLAGLSRRTSEAGVAVSLVSGSGSRGTHGNVNVSLFAFVRLSFLPEESMEPSSRD